jgi:RNA polymerase sigma-70 factor (ECF subfamily)
LVAQSVQGDAAGFATLVERYQRVLYTVAYRMLGNPDDARDAVQASFLKAFERLATFNPEHRFFSWMYRIVMNECLNLIRDRHPEESLTPALAAAGGPFDTAVVHERQVQVQAALLQLSPDYRARRRATPFRRPLIRRDGGSARRAVENSEVAAAYRASASW